MNPVTFYWLTVGASVVAAVIFLIIIWKKRRSIVCGLKSRKFWISLILLCFASGLVFLFGFYSAILGIAAVLVVPPIISALLCFTVVKEGTGKVITKFDQFSRVLIQQRGKTISGPAGDVIPGTEYHLLGGLRWFGFWPFHKVYEYDFEWTGVKADGTFEEHPRKRLDYVLLKDDVYGCRVENAEDHAQMPVDIDLTITVQVINPYKALFMVENWFETLINRLTPYVRDFMTNHTFQELIENVDLRLDVAVMEKLTAEGIIDEFRDRYGLEIRRLEVREIDPGPEYRGITLKKLVASRDAEARGEETTGVLLRMMAQATGKTIQEIQEQINKKGSKLRREFLTMAQDLLHRRIAIDGNAFVDVRVQGASGLEGTLLNLLSVWRRMPQGRAPVTNPVAAPHAVPQPVGAAPSTPRRSYRARPDISSDDEAEEFLQDLEDEEEEEEEKKEE